MENMELRQGSALCESGESVEIFLLKHTCVRM